MAKKAEQAKAARKAAKQQRKSAMAKKVISKVKKKKWVPMFAPPFFANQVLGESLVVEAQDLVGRKISVSIANLTKEMRKQAYSVQFQAISEKGTGVQTAMVGFELAHGGTKRLVRKNRTKVLDSFLIKTADDKVARIKPFIVTRNKVPHSLQTRMRLTARQLLAREANTQSFQQLMEQAITGKLQKMLKVNLQKFYPLSACELRAFKLEKANTPLELGETVMEMPKRKPRARRDDKPRDAKPKAEAPKEAAPEAKAEEKKEVTKEEKAEPAKEEAAPEAKAEPAKEEPAPKAEA